MNKWVCLHGRNSSCRVKVRHCDSFVVPSGVWVISMSQFRRSSRKLGVPPFTVVFDSGDLPNCGSLYVVKDDGSCYCSIRSF